MNVVILDGYTVNPGDLDWQPIRDTGDLTVYERSRDEEIVPRAGNADVLVVNKVKIRAHHMDALPRLKAICLLATGYDNVDTGAARERGIRVYNAVGYGTESVAQHTLAMILAFTNRVESHHHSVQSGDWSNQEDFSYSLNTVRELKGKTAGIIGYGKIGMRVGELLKAFGMNVITIYREGKKSDIEMVGQEEFFRKSVLISLHAPLTEATREIINGRSLSWMPSEAMIVNTGRGGLINEADLLEAVRSGKIAGAILDVLSIEPPVASNPLLFQKNILVTPHMAWRSLEARKELIKIVAQNIISVSRQSNENRVV